MSLVPVLVARKSIFWHAFPRTASQAGATALCVAAANGHLEVTCALVAFGADPAPPVCAASCT